MAFNSFNVIIFSDPEEIGLDEFDVVVEEVVVFDFEVDVVVVVLTLHPVNPDLCFTSHRWAYCPLLSVHSRPGNSKSQLVHLLLLSHVREHCHQLSVFRAVRVGTQPELW